MPISSNGERWGWPGGRPKGDESWELFTWELFTSEKCDIVRRMQRTAFLAITALFFTGLARPQQTICCNCKSETRGPFKVPEPAGFPPATVCQTGCEINGGRWLRTTSSCSVPLPSPPPSLFDAVKLIVTFEGPVVYIGSDGNTLLKGAALRNALLDKRGSEAIKNADDATLEQTTIDALAACVNERPISADMEYVCRGDDLHAGAQKIVRSLLKENTPNFAEVRKTFSNMQSHDDNIKNRLTCYSGSQIKSLVKDHCPTPKPREPPALRTGH